MNIFNSEIVKTTQENIVKVIAIYNKEFYYPTRLRVQVTRQTSMGNRFNGLFVVLFVLSSRNAIARSLVWISENGRCWIINLILGFEQASSGVWDEKNGRAENTPGSLRFTFFRPLHH